MAGTHYRLEFTRKGEWTGTSSDCAASTNATSRGGNLPELIEYVTNNTEAWTFPELLTETAENKSVRGLDWESYIVMLDTAILSLIGEMKYRMMKLLPHLILLSLSRFGYIWANSTPIKRRGYFLAGIDLATGHTLDAVAILAENHEASIATITSIAELVFPINPFIPISIPDNWRDILRSWLLLILLAVVAVGQEAGGRNNATR